MPALWGKSGEAWKIIVPIGFPVEKERRDRIEEAPQMLPLSGAPRLTVLGREVRLGSGFADLIAVEASGRVTIIEVKLSGNTDARRAVVAQMLDYAAYVRGQSVEHFENEILKPHLAKSGADTIAEVVRTGDEQGSFDGQEFGERWPIPL